MTTLYPIFKINASATRFIENNLWYTQCIYIEWNKVTWYSKLFALALFVALPFIGFYFGISYGEAIRVTHQTGAVQNSNTQSTDYGNEYYGNVSEWQTERSSAGAFTMAYPIDFDAQESYAGAPTADWRLNANGTMGIKYFLLTIPRAFEPQTNFVDATLTVGASANATAIKDCLTPDPSGGSATASTATINGILFSVFKSTGAGAGNYYETTSYRSLHDGKCYAIEYTVHSSQIANYPVEYNLHTFDQTRVRSLLNRIVGTFQYF